MPQRRHDGEPSEHPRRVTWRLQAARRASAPGSARRTGPTTSPRSRASPTATIPPTGWCAGRTLHPFPPRGRLRGAGGFHPREHLPGGPRGIRGRQPRRLLFDAADTPNGQSLEEVLRSTWNDTIEPGSLRTDDRQRPAGGHSSLGRARNGRSGSRPSASATPPFG